MEQDFRENNLIENTVAYKHFEAEFDENIDFYSQLSDLISMNGVITSFFAVEAIYELDTSLLDSAVETLKSIKSCCQRGSFADANTLIRKFRDDSILYIFILDTIRNRKAFYEEDLDGLIDKENKLDFEKFAESFNKIRINSVMNDNEKAVEAWFGNFVEKLPNQQKKKLSFENYMKMLKEDPNIAKTLSNYRLEKYWEALRQNLNDYVHNNGQHFSNQNLINSDSGALMSSLKDVNFRTSYISTFFLVLLLMVDSKSVCSTDYGDYMDSGLTPPENSQYLIAGFIQDFIDDKVVKLHPELKQFLVENNNHGMKIS